MRGNKYTVETENFSRAKRYKDKNNNIQNRNTTSCYLHTGNNNKQQGRRRFETNGKDGNKDDTGTQRNGVGWMKSQKK